VADPLRDLAIALFTLEPGTRKRVWFHPTAAPRLFLADLSPAGRAAYGERLKAASDSGALRGLVVAEPSGRLVLVGKRAEPGALVAIAKFVASKIKAVPALGALIDLGVATADLDLGDDDALAALDVAKLSVHRAPELWAGLRAPTAAGLARTVSRLRPGQSCWFRLASGGGADAVPLVLQPVEHDAGEQLTRAQAAELPAGPILAGLATLTDAGVLQLRSTGGGMPYLVALAAWVQAQAGAHPALALLAHAELVHLGPGAVVDRIDRDPALWEGLRRALVPGTLTASLAAVRKLAVGEEARVWVNHSPDDGAFLLAVPRAKDPAGEAFGSLRAAMPRRFADTKRAASGVLKRVSETTTLVSTDPASARDAADALAALCDADPRGASLLAAATVAGVDDGHATIVADVQGRVLLRAAARDLTAFDGSSDLFFWFASADRDGIANLCLSSERAALAAGVERWSAGLAPGRLLRGRVRRTDDGRLSLQSRRSVPGAGEALAAFVQRTASRVPGLDALQGAEFATVDRAGAVVRP